MGKTRFPRKLIYSRGQLATILGPWCDETVCVGLNLSEIKKRLKICRRSAQSEVAAAKHF